MNQSHKNTNLKNPEASLFGKLAVGLESSLVDPFEYTVEFETEYGELGTALQDYLDNSLSCTGIKPENVSRDISLDVIEEHRHTSADEEERDIYFYHTDHLVSSSWITYTDGSVTQHMQNLPFGEPFIDQRATSYDIRYIPIAIGITGKEMDTEIKQKNRLAKRSEENLFFCADSPNTIKINYWMRQTGYQFPIAIGIGARYNSDISVWLSVDPMSDEYPSTSPYSYVEGNPIMFIDPTGMFKDSTSAMSSQQKAINSLGENRVGDLYNRGTEENPDYAYPVFRDGENKYIQIDENGNEYNYTSDAVIGSRTDEAIYDRANLASEKLYKNNEIVKGIWNDYILYDNRWLWCESQETYEKRRDNYSNPKGGVATPRGFPQTYKYMQKVVQLGGANNVGIGVGITGVEKLITKSSKFGPISIIGSFIVGQWDAYINMTKRMEQHDEMVDFNRKQQ
jgi:RHS repeat-associated protein